MCPARAPTTPRALRPARPVQEGQHQRERFSAMSRLSREAEQRHAQSARTELSRLHTHTAPPNPSCALRPMQVEQRHAPSRVPGPVCSPPPCALRPARPVQEEQQHQQRERFSAMSRMSREAEQRRVQCARAELNRLRQLEAAWPSRIVLPVDRGSLSAMQVGETPGTWTPSKTLRDT